MIKAVNILLSFIFLFSQKTQGASANSHLKVVFTTHSYIYIPFILYF